METPENFCCFDYIKKDFLIFLKRGLLSNSEDGLTALVYMKKSALKSDVHLCCSITDHLLFLTKKNVGKT